MYNVQCTMHIHILRGVFGIRPVGCKMNSQLCGLIAPSDIALSEWLAMYGRWTENVELSRIFLGWRQKNVKRSSTVN